MAETLGTEAGSVDPNADPEKERAEVLTAREIIASAAVEIAEDALPEDFRREFQSIDESSIVDRLASLLTNPAELFAKLNVSSGWLAPLVLVALAALLNAAIVMGTADLDGWFELQRRKTKQAMPEWQQRRMAADGPAALRTQERMQSFALKAGLFVMPVLKTLFELAFFSAVLFVLAVMSDGQRSLRLCAVVVAHAQLVDVVKSFAMAIVTAGTGLPIVMTSPAGLVGESGDAVLRGV
jgi:hypothetical protein